MSQLVLVPIVAFVAACRCLAALAPLRDDFRTLDEARWVPVNLFGQRKLPGLRVTAGDGVLRIKGTTSDEGLSLGGVRTAMAFSASADKPFTIEVTRAFHGGRGTRAELGVLLWRSVGQFVYVREPLHSLFKDWNHYQSWQVLAGGRRKVTDISDEDAFLAAHPQPPFACKIHRVSRTIRLIHDGAKVTVYLDGRERAAVDAPWGDHFVLALVAGAWRAGVPVEAGFSGLAITGQSLRPLKAIPIDAASWEPAAPTYWQGDVTLEPGAVEKVRAREDKAQLAMVVRSMWPPKQQKAFIDWTIEKGLNCVALDIKWRRVERVPGRYDFSAYDGIVNYAVNRGLFVQLKPWWIRREYPDWISPALEQKSVGPGKRLQELTFAHDELNDRIARFVGAVVEHYRGYPVTCYTPVGATAAELEYAHGQYQDASDWAQQQFRQWLRRHYEALARLDAAWGTKHTAWDAVRAPTDLKAPSDGPDLRQHIVDWFCYREWAIKQLVDRLGKAIHNADPDAVFAIQMGRILDGPACPRRATLGAFYWGAAADMFIADPQPKNGDVMGYVIDLVRAGGKRAGMELDAPARFEIPLDNYATNTIACWRHGGLWSSWANWRPKELEEPSSLNFTQASVQAMNTPFHLKPHTTAMFVSKWDLYGHRDRSRWREYRDAYARLTDNGLSATDAITDDVLLAQPQVLKRYTRIDVPFADCLDKRVRDLLAGERARLRVMKPASFASHIVDVAH